MKKAVIACLAVAMTTPAFGQAVNVNGNLSFNPTTNGVVGTATNDNASAGTVGEFMSSTVLKASSVSLTSGTTANVTSLTLTAGDWDVWGQTVTNPAPATIQSVVTSGINTISATLPPAAGPNATSTNAFNIPTGNGLGSTLPIARISIASSTTVYLVISSNFSGGTNGGYGFIAARRVR